MISRDMVGRLIVEEVDRAYRKHGRDQWGRHEFLGIILEEFEEMKQDIMADARQDILEKEIIQVAAMCLRYLETGDRYREPTAPAVSISEGKIMRMAEALYNEAPGEAEEPWEDYVTKHKLSGTLDSTYWVQMARRAAGVFGA